MPTSAVDSSTSLSAISLSVNGWSTVYTFALNLLSQIYLLLANRRLWDACYRVAFFHFFDHIV